MHHFKWKNGVVNERDSQIILVVSNDFWWMIWDDFWFLLNLDEFLTWFTSLCMFFWFDDVFKWMTLTPPGVTWKNHLPTSLHFMESHGVTWPWKWHPKDSLQRRTFSNKIEKKNPPFELQQIRKNIRSTPSTQIQLWNLKKTTQGKIPQTKSPFHMDFFVDFGRWTLKPNWPGHCYKKNRDERRAGQASRKTWLGPIVLKHPRLKRSPNQWPWVFRRSLRAALKAGKLTFLGKTVWLFFGGGGGDQFRFPWWKGKVLFFLPSSWFRGCIFNIGFLSFRVILH